MAIWHEVLHSRSSLWVLRIEQILLLTDWTMAPNHDSFLAMLHLSLRLFLTWQFGKHYMESQNMKWGQLHEIKNTCSYSFIVLALTGDIRPLPPVFLTTTKHNYQNQQVRSAMKSYFQTQQYFSKNDIHSAPFHQLRFPGQNFCYININNNKLPGTWFQKTLPQKLDNWISKSIICNETEYNSAEHTWNGSIFKLKML